MQTTEDPADISGEDLVESPSTGAQLRANVTRDAKQGAKNTAAPAPQPGPEPPPDQSQPAPSKKKSDGQGKPLLTDSNNLERQVQAHMWDPLAPLFDRGKKDSPSLWQDTQYWGSVMNAAIGPQPIQSSLHSIYNDNSSSGRIKQSLADAITGPFGAIHQALGISPAMQKWWEDSGITSAALSGGASMEAGIYVPEMVANLPSDPKKAPEALGFTDVPGLASSLMHDPGMLKDPEWWQHVGHTAMSSMALTGMIIPPFRALGKASPAVARLLDHINFLKTPQEKLPITLEDGRTIDPYGSPQDFEHYGFIQKAMSEVPPLDEARKLAVGAVKDFNISPRGAAVTTGRLLQGAEKSPQEVVGRKLQEQGKLNPQQIKDLNSFVEHQHLQEFARRLEEGEYTNKELQWIQKNWQMVQKTLKFSMPLDHWHPAEPHMDDPMSNMAAMPKQHQAAATEILSKGNFLLGHIATGLFGHEDDVMGSVFRSMAAGERVTKKVAGDYVKTLQKHLTPDELAAIPRAVEDLSGKLASELSPLQKTVYDLHRQISGSIGTRSVAYGRFQQRVPGYVARVAKRTSSSLPANIKSGAAVSKYLSNPSRHRAVGVGFDESGGIVSKQLYKTIGDANNELRMAKGELMSAIMEDHPKMSQSEAKALVDAHIPTLSEDYAEILAADLPKSIKNLHFHQAMDLFSHSSLRSDDLKLPVAYRHGGLNPHLDPSLRRLKPADRIAELQARGYKRLEGSGVAAEHYVHSGFADLYNAFMADKNHSAGKIESFVNSAQRWALKFIMMNPLWHSTNMAGRALSMTFSHPISTFKAVAELGGKGFKDDESARLAWQAARQRAMAHGMIQSHGGGDMMAEFSKQHMQATGDIGIGSSVADASTVVDPASPLAKDPSALAGFGRAVGNVVPHMNDWFWARYDDFGTLAYLAEEKAALSKGLNPVQAGLYAASRANAWKGSVSPEQWAKNPTLHQISKRLMFAPQWWRSFYQLLSGSFDRAGMGVSDAMAAKMRTQAVGKGLFGLWASNAVTGNALNYLLSGHMQYENQPNNKHSIELDRIAPLLGRQAVNPQTGAHLVSENPFARQQKDLFKAMGLTAPPEDYAFSHLDPSAPAPGQSDPGYQQAEVIASRAAPLIDMLTTASNFDLYGSLLKHSVQFVDPEHPAPMSSLAALGLSLGSLTPFGLQAAQQLTPHGQAPTSGPQSPSTGPLAGSGVPEWVTKTFGLDTQDHFQQALGSFAGVRGPYEAANRTAGGGLSTEDATDVRQYEEKYNSNLTRSEHDVVTGANGMTPNKWLTQYTAASKARSEYLQAKYQNSSDYTDGAAGALAQYEALYNAPGVQMDNGDINNALLAQKQAELHDQILAKPGGAEIWSMMQSNLHKNDLQHPVLKVWHDAQSEFKTWQEGYAQQSGLSGPQFRDLLNQYYAIPVAADRAKFEQQNPELRKYSAAKAKWERTTGAGFTYGMFTNSSYISGLVAHLGSQGEAKYLEHQVQAEEGSSGAGQ